VPSRQKTVGEENSNQQKGGKTKINRNAKSLTLEIKMEKKNQEEKKKEAQK
jgi:hypothetical protein